MVDVLSVVEVHHQQINPSEDHRIDPTRIRSGESSGKVHQKLHGCTIVMIQEEEVLYSISKEVVSY